MKGNKMSAILAILLMLSGAIAIPIAHMQPTAPVTGVGSCTGVAANVVLTQATTGFDTWTSASVAGAEQVNPNIPFPPVTNLHFQAGTNGTTGTKFWVDVDAYDVTFLSTFTVGFAYNPSLLTPIAISNGSAIDAFGLYGLGDILAVPGKLTYAPGIVSAYGLSATDSYYMNGTGTQTAIDLMNFEFEITGTLPYQESVAGIPQSLMNFSYTAVSYPLLIEDVWGNAYTPAPQNATITYTLPPPHAPVASSTVNGVLPPTVPTVTTGTAVTFDASGSSPGWNGTGNVPITKYYWDLLWNSTLVTTTTPTITVTFATAATYTLDLTVNAQLGSYNMNSTNVDAQSVLVVTPPTGCLITLYTQSWRYIDPNMWTTMFTGDKSGLTNNTEADSFRPGDLVQLFANATYNGAPVSNALVTFEVFDNKNNVVLIATAITGCTGVAEWDFRIPWPSSDATVTENFTQGSTTPVETNASAEFGQWTAYATWQLGSQYTEQPPFEKTQTACITFYIGWGLSISIESITPNPAMRGPNSCGYGSDVVVKVNVVNDYLEAVQGLVTVTIYDNLLVPIYPPAEISAAWPVGISYQNTTSIEIPSYAFVGTGYVVANLLSTVPSLAGTAFCPTLIATIVISPYK